jgi:outer membrane protein OmpA-like peptidoglycan-associated protein
LWIDVSAQIINVPNRIQNKVNNRINRKIDQGIDKGLDAIEDSIKGNNKKSNTPATQKADPKKTGTTSTAAGSKGDAKQDQESLKSYSNYDFVPGDKVLIFEDFSQDAVGDFPALWTTDVAGEVNTLNLAPGHWFNLNSTEGNYWFMNDIDFPKNFIIEFDIVPKKGGARYAADLVLFGESSHSEMDKNGDPGNCGVHVTIAKTLWETKGYKKGVTEKLTGTSTNKLVQEEKVNHVIVWVQGRRLRIYHQGGKVIDVPTNIYEGSKFTRMCFKLYRGASCGSYISNIKITNAAPDTRNKLLTEGKLVTYGIYFDVNKDVVKPESYGTLNDIAKILNEVPDVKVKIVGHTDADGADAANLDLSKRRAASVKAELVKTFNVNGDRLVTDGLGESQPVAPNDTPANKAMNRRVEFIKL